VAKRVPLIYNAFDLLFLKGKDLRKEPLSAQAQTPRSGTKPS
jgi:ATP-dependent DNA ligase